MSCEIDTEDELRMGHETWLPSKSPKQPYAVVFEDDGVSGYFYACLVGENGQTHILDAVHIYNVEDVTDAHIPSMLAIGWSPSGQQAMLLINEYPHAVFDFADQMGYCQTGFPPVPENDWCRNDHQWNDKTLEHFK